MHSLHRFPATRAASLDVLGAERHCVWSSVDGTVEMISHRLAQLYVGLREYGTQQYVRAVLQADDWLDVIHTLFDTRVVVEGRVTYNEDDRPIRIAEIRSVTPKETDVSLRDLRGAFPDLGGGRRAEELIAALRGDDI